MIIEVKGTKTSESDGPSQQHYMIEERKSSKTPLAFGAFLFGIAIYLKSAMPGWGRLPADEEADEPPQTPTAGQIDPEQMLAQLAAQFTEVPTEHDRSDLSGSGRSFIKRAEPSEFMTIESPLIGKSDYPVQSFEPVRFGGMNFANDNGGSTAQTGTRSNGGGGVSSEGEGTEPGQDTPVASRPDGRGAAPGQDTPVASRPDGSGAGPGQDKPGAGQHEARPPTDGSDLEDADDHDEDETEDKGIDDDDEDEDEDDGLNNRTPRSTGPVYLHDVFGCAAMLFAISDFLKNATDPDGDALSISNLTVSSGTIKQSGDSWLYDPNGLGPVTVSYQITDGEFFVDQFAYFSVLKNPPIIGTETADVIVGTECADVIKACGGDDNVDARGGNDTVEGGDGDDHIIAGSGDDIVFGGFGHDIIFGGLGDDQISGGEGNDRLFGDEGNDVLFGDGGDDQLAGGSGDDALFGGAGDDAINGEHGDDILQGNSGNDRLDGGHGDDLVAGGAGDDTVTGGIGNDTLIDEMGTDTVSGGEGNDHVVVALDDDADTYDGGTGTDILDLTPTERGVFVDLAAGSANGVEIGRNSIDAFETVLAGSGNDKILGSANAEKLLGGAGNDHLDGGLGDDLVAGGAGDDILLDEAGADSVSGGEGNDHVVVALDGDADTYDGGTGTDILDLSATESSVSIDLAAGSANGQEIGRNFITAFETALAGSGNDTIIGAENAEKLIGGGGNDQIEGAAGDDVIEGGAGCDVLMDGAGIDIVAGGTGDDLIKVAADATNDTFDGGGGFDTLDYSASGSAIVIDLTTGQSTGIEVGTDTINNFESIVGGNGDDHFIVGSSPVTLTGGLGDDTFEFHASASAVQSTLLHEIEDFEVGDSVHVDRFDIFERVMDALNDEFERIYGDEVNEAESGIRYRHEFGSVDRTIIEADIDRDTFFETTIFLQGHHALVVVESV